MGIVNLNVEQFLATPANFYDDLAWCEAHCPWTLEGYCRCCERDTERWDQRGQPYSGVPEDDYVDPVWESYRDA